MPSSIQGAETPSNAGEARAHLSRPHDSCLFSGPSNGPTGTLCASTHDADDADGTDGIFGTRAHRDDSSPDPAPSREQFGEDGLSRLGAPSLLCFAQDRFGCR